LPPSTPPEGKLKGDLITEAFSCVAQSEKDRCKNGGGTCTISRDGYYIINILCVIVGVVTFLGYIKPAALKLQSLPLKAWRLGGNGTGGNGAH
jgi:MFS transporter, PAT family, solute carrier family 33 (acetyl-CoA transportor), member 1